MPEHEKRCAALQAAVLAARAGGRQLGLRKKTSNLFRRRTPHGKLLVDVNELDGILEVDPERRLARVEGMAPYETIVNATLPHDLIPQVTPQLKTITAGGAVSGLGIEATSFRRGLVHETVEEMRVLTGDGRVLTCSEHENPGLFFGLPNSYGTLGYILSLTLRLDPAGRLVHVRHKRFESADCFFGGMAEACRRPEVHFADGVVFDKASCYLSTGEFAGEGAAPSDYTGMRIYYRSIGEKAEDWLTTGQYLWRWDTDWFWCSKQFGVQNPFLRFFARPGLNSRAYQRLMRLSHMLPDFPGNESVIQDVAIPIAKATDFLEFLLSGIGILPVWICPFRTLHSAGAYPLCPVAEGTLSINFGFWDVVHTGRARGYLNRQIEAKARELGGTKGLYSRSYYDADTFWEIYDRPRYEALKAQYDPGGVFPGLYEKCVEGR